MRCLKVAVIEIDFIIITLRITSTLNVLDTDNTLKMIECLRLVHFERKCGRNLSISEKSNSNIGKVI